jgi:predicted nucleic acid-binding protein
MKVAFDASFLVFTVNPRSNSSVARAPERVDGLIERLTEKKDKIIVPTPALAEILVVLGQGGPKYIEKMREFSCFQVRAFDERAAVEFGATMRARSKGKQKQARKNAVQSKIKFDHQIVAIAKVQGAKAIYSDDSQLRAFAEECGMDAYGLADVPVPMKQDKLPFKESDEN